MSPILYDFESRQIAVLYQTIKQMSCCGFCDIVVCTLHEWWLTWGHTNWPPNYVYTCEQWCQKRCKPQAFLKNLTNNTIILNSSPWYFPRAASYAHIGFRSLLLSKQIIHYRVWIQTGPDISPARYLIGVYSSSLISIVSHRSMCQSAYELELLLVIFRNCHRVEI